jgi:AmmeMemoRadiSam system protein A
MMERSRLNDAEKQLLLQIARGAIEDQLSGGPAWSPETVPEILREKRGIFVTLHKGGRLRGCIGYIDAVKPLHEAVGEMARAAAFGDPRFSPVRSDEAAQLELEISVLTPLRKIQDPSEIQVGQHGLYITGQARSGLLLPQVATEYGWDRETFLEHTCLKAGLQPEAWRDPKIEIFVFEADIFVEGEA